MSRRRDSAVPVPLIPPERLSHTAERDKKRSLRKHAIRSKTVSAKRYPRQLLEAEGALYPEAILHPKSRSECEEGLRPCPYVSCKYNLYLDVEPKTGSLKYNFPDREPEEVPEDESCVLDVIDKDGSCTLELTGDLLNMTRERVRQIETKALRRLGASFPILRELAEPGPPSRLRSEGATGRTMGTQLHNESAIEPPDDATEAENKVPRKEKTEIETARELAAFVNEVFAEMRRRWRTFYKAGKVKVVRARPTRLLEAWRLAMAPPPPIGESEVIVGVDAIRRSRPKSRPLFVSRSSSAPLDDAVLAALVNKRVGRSVSDLAWELGEAPVDVEDAILRLEETGKVEKDRRKLWRAR